MKNKKLIVAVSIFVFLILAVASNIAFSQIYGLPEQFYTNYEEIEKVNKDGKFGNIVKLKLDKNDIETNKSENNEGFVVFKLFGLIPIKKIYVKILPEDEVYVGGNPIGLNVYTEGAIVVSDSIIDYKTAKINKNQVLKNGDIIKKINGEEIENLEDIENLLEDLKEDIVDITFIRNNKEYNSQIPLLKDNEGSYKLGVWVRDDISGIGTMTFVKKDNTYGALGHAVTNGKSDNIIDIRDGELYNCKQIGIEKGQKNKPGELKCLFLTKDKKGDIKKNTKYGIFGRLDDNENIIDSNLKLNIGGRLSVKPGKAKIISCVSGIREEYEIEIIKANYQAKSDDKSIVFRVKDKRLLELTGGIVQGMSGSPIIQDDKIVGAVTHVFLSDPTKGYGVYSDWMLEQLDFN